MLDIISFPVSILLTLIVSYVLFNSLKFYLDLKRKKKYINKLPGGPLHPILGHFAGFPGPGEEGLLFMVEKSSEVSEGIAKLSFGPFIPGVGVFHPEKVKEVLKSSEPKPKAYGPYKMLLPWLGDGLLIAGGQKWARNRKLLTPAFHFDILKPYIAINNKCVDVFLEKTGNIAEKGKSFEIFNHVSLLTLDIILKCAFSYDTDCQKVGKEHPYVSAVLELSQAIAYRVLRPWLYSDWVFLNLTSVGRKYARDCNYVHSVSEDIVNKRKNTLKARGKSVLRHEKYIDFLDILLTCKDTDGKGLADTDIRNEVDTFLFEGHDTTASGISWTLYALAEHPEFQRRCQEEIDGLLEGRESDDILWDDLGKLPYLTLCLKEALRLHTPVPVIQRVSTKDFEMCGYQIPADVILDVNIYILHHNEQVWDAPFEYRPERFSPENTEKMDPFAFVPFSAGPRNCIGQNFAMHEMKVVIARTLRKFNLEIDPDRKAKHELVVVMKTEEGMYLKFTPRSHGK